MCCVRFPMSPADRKEVECQLKTAKRAGNLRQAKYLLALLAVLDGQSVAQFAVVVVVPEKTVATWGGVFCCYGSKGAPCRKPTGRPPNSPRRRKPLSPRSLTRGRSRPVSAAPAGAHP